MATNVRRDRCFGGFVATLLNPPYDSGICAMSCDSNKCQVKKEQTNRFFSYDRSIEQKPILLDIIHTLFRKG